MSRQPGGRRDERVSQDCSTAQQLDGEWAASHLPLTGCARVDSRARGLPPWPAATRGCPPFHASNHATTAATGRLGRRDALRHPDLLSEHVRAGIKPGVSRITLAAGHNDVQSVRKLQAARLRERQQKHTQRSA
ncbi:unnamed protein product [Urochloa humidicola]